MTSAAFFSLSGHAYFIWASYGMLALAVLFELSFLRRRRLQALRQASLIAKDAPVRQASVKEAGLGGDHINRQSVNTSKHLRPDKNE